MWRGGLFALCLVAPAMAASDHSSGDGSDADNERLVPGIYPADPVLESGEWLREPYHPFFDIDWSVALRGSYTKATGGERFDVHLVPRATLTHEGARSTLVFDGTADIVRPNSGQVDVSGLRLGLDAGYALDSVTTLTGTGSFELNQPLAGTPGISSTVERPAQSLTGTVGAGITRRFGKFSLGVTGSASRSVYGPTILAGGTSVDNAEQNLWSLDAGLRLGFQATPIFEVFGVAGLGRDIFDQPSVALMTKADATDASIGAGVTGRWNDILEATAETGLVLRRFDDTSLGEVAVHTYDASLSFTPDPTWRFTASLGTNVAPPGPSGSGTTRVEYTAKGEAAYMVNSWLAWRAMVDWNNTRYVGSPNTVSGHGWGIGADYNVNAHTAVTADYDYDYSDSSTDGVQDAHRVTIGITLSR